MAAVLVHIDLDGDRPHASSLGALAAGRHLATSWGATLYAAIIVSGQTAATDAERTLARGGADKVVVATSDAPVTPLWATVGGAWTSVLDQLRPRVVLFGADAPSSPELGPRTGARIGARLLGRARLFGHDELELRDRDGTYARAGDSGAVVALIGRAAPASGGDEDVDRVVITATGGADTRIELAGTQPAEVAHGGGAIVALGDNVAKDPKVIGHAQRLASLLGGQLVGGAAAASVIAPGAVVERTTPLAPELCVTVGNAQLDLAGSTALIRIGVAAGKTAEGALAAPIDTALAELVKRLEDA